MTTQSESKPKAKKPALKTIEASYLKGRQSIEFRGIYNLAGFKLKVRIDRDSYDFQSSAVIYVWKTDKLEWSTVASIHYSEMAAKQVFCYSKPEELTYSDKAAFDTDRKRLLKLAEQILF